MLITLSTINTIFIPKNLLYSLNKKKNRFIGITKKFKIYKNQKNNHKKNIKKSNWKPKINKN